MKNRQARTALELAALAMRKIVLSLEPGALIGSEEALIAKVGFSRSTVRQGSRLLEREGLIRVRRGINGGYFSARPDAGTIEATVSSYMETLDVDADDITVVASALWIEAMRKAARAEPGEAQALADQLIAKVKAIRDGTPFDRIRELELEVQAKIFELARSTYVKLIFDINVAFSRRRFSAPISDDTSDEHRRFIRAWRDGKILELSAIAEGDVELAAMAGRHSRDVWHRRIRSRFANPPAGPGQSACDPSTGHPDGQ